MDIYSLGVTLHQMLTLHDQERSWPFEPPHNVNPAVTPALSQVVVRALRRALAGRFADARGPRGGTAAVDAT